MARIWLVSASTAVLAATFPQAAAAQGDSILEELIVTAQKREQSVQDVPIAVSAFSQQALKAQGIDGPGNLVQSVPNLTFTRRSQRTNFQIRGVGAQLVATGGDDGVGIHHNNVPLTSNRAADAEFYDVERVEVLRGPQGTLYGRNATGGVVNVITNKPVLGDFQADVTAEFGNYNSMKHQGFLNLPLGDKVALRVAAFGLDRDGYTTNTLNGQDIDSRQIWAGRVTLAFEPGERFRGFLLWDSFAEDDTRGARKQLCAKDPGLTSVRGVPTGVAQAVLTSGCLPVSVFDDASYGSTNYLATFPGIIGRQVGLQTVDAFGGKTISRDLREAEVYGRPVYRPRAEIYELNLEWDATDALKITSLTSYNENETYSLGDFGAVRASVPFAPSPLAPAGLLTDGQFGTTDRAQSQSGSVGHAEQWTQELRLQSNFDGPINFNVGGIYLDYKATSIAYFASNIATAAVRVINPAAYVDPLSNPDFTGHNYFVNETEYDLTSKAAFGEVYWRAADDLRVTVGLRYTDDKKRTRGSGATLFAAGRGPLFGPYQDVRFKELTGRFNVDWSPDLSFTDDTLVYASYAKGYKGGGFNPPGVVALGLAASYDPEFVNAIEVGAKNTLLDGRLLLNVTAFHYDYKGYQIARSVNRSIFNENVDATIKGLEFESVWEPLDGLRLNANLGYLDTRIKDGRGVDTFNRTQGDPTYIYGNSTAGGCILNAQGVAAVLQQAAGPAALAAVACSGPAALSTRLATAGIAPATAAALSAGVYSYGADVALYSSGAGEGVIQDLKGNDLPNAPTWTVSLGAQYRWVFANGWSATLRGDYYRQSSTMMRYNNAAFDRVRAWDNLNASLIVDLPEHDLSIQAFVKNIQNSDTIVGFDIADENVGATREVIVLDPRLYGVSITKRF
ncbi:TonB-dependent receptor [Phenylobacterium sp.]|uniref:TonB-dependent receptor n=1 Tax=Phenylobacterium sp. TaxID=1871053 RepID=UPI00301D5831